MRLLLSALFFSFNLFATSYVTYNIGMAHSFVPYAKERLPHIIDALQKESADFYCLQEAWIAEDRDQIIESLKGSHPYSYFVEPQEQRAQKSPTCGVLELFGKEGFGRCIASQCLFKGSDDLTSCVLKKCKDPMLTLIKSNQECALGLMANVGGSPVGALLSVFNPFKGAPVFAYGGGNGLLLLSKKEMSDTSYADYSKISTLNRRGTLQAVVDGKKIYCSHLTANLGGTAYYGGNQTSWENENRLQIARLINLMKRSSLPMLNMGDFNCSMGKGDINSDFDSNCKQFENAGFSNEYFLKMPECSFCKKNSLVSGKTDFLLDHIFSKGVISSKQELIFKEMVKLEDVDQLQNISDHYGLKAEY